MTTEITNKDEILDAFIEGFHIYSFEGKAHIKYASKNLACILGVDPSFLMDENEDIYLSFIYPEDRPCYENAMDELAKKETQTSLKYKIKTKDGKTLCVKDDLKSRLSPDGTMEGYSVLCDITELVSEKHTLQFLNEALPCGFLKYTCEKHPKVTYANKEMLKIMGIPEKSEGEIDYYEIYKENIFLMIPMEERARFSLALGSISLEDAPIAGELTVTRFDGKKSRLFGWISKHLNEEGQEEFISVCMDITERYRLNKEKETNNYIRALTDVYDKIFEYDYSGNTVKCLYWQNCDRFKWMMNVPMQMDDATEKWIETTVYTEDRDKVKQYFKAFHNENIVSPDSKPHVIDYREQSYGNESSLHTGIFLKIDSSTALFCCKKATDEMEAQSLRSENESLKNMQEMVMRFSDGISAFQVKERMVTPLYISDNVLEFFKFTKEEWMPMMKKAVPIKTLVSRCGIDYQEFMLLLERGEAEFTYYDLTLKKERHIKAITSQKTPDGNLPFYVMLYNLDANKAKGEENVTSKVFIRTFGYFDVFVDGKPIAFRNEKSKELFALLVDRRGGFITSEEAISFLWEDVNADSASLARYRKVALKLKNILEEYGISHIIESVNGKRRLITEEVECDLYNYLSGKEEYKNLFKGNYLSNYSWGEATLGELLSI